ncbi:hypothetical protein IF1G_07074 [Cordyceps javanica]|uniref:Uncharacterized protein n=1 Tax=Cordyceps javanica TaxID=43265 RepID=A0A545UXJ7_9HYPO|nr:hypothetical protein IF1G_07074 [Cordyceps javanica]
MRNQSNLTLARPELQYQYRHVASGQSVWQGSWSVWCDCAKKCKRDGNKTVILNMLQSFLFPEMGNTICPRKKNK